MGNPTTYSMTLHVELKIGQRTIDQTIPATDVYYANERELDIALQYLQTETFRIGWFDTLSHLRDVLAERGALSQHLTFVIKDEEYPPFVYNVLKKIADQFPAIQSIQLKNKQDDLIKDLSKHISRHTQEQRRRSMGHKFAAALAIVLPAFFTLMGLPIYATLLWVGRETLLGSALIALRQKYLDFSVRPYIEKEKLKKIVDPNEISALYQGTRSINWGNYILSQFSLEAWKKPRAFAAGLELALEQKEKHIEIIRDKRSQLN